MSDAPDISRRDLLRGRLGRRPGAEEGATGPAGGPGGRAAGERGAAAPAVVHRPPGAVEEPAFLSGCTRCGDCISVCPVDAIRVAGERFGPAAGTPVIEPMISACVMCEDLPCIAACEPGVLSPEAPVEMGTARIRLDACLAWQGTMCTVCSERCPVEGAIRVERGRPTVVAETCTGCGTCQHVCPAPYNAVLILPRAAGTATADDAAPGGDGRFDWRAAYFEGRSLRPPGA